jgi:hypothetical protein
MGQLMMFARRNFVVTMASAVLSLMMVPASAKDAFKPTPTLVMEARAALGAVPQDVILSGKFAYVLGLNAEGLSEIEVRDASSLELIANKTVEFSIEDIASDPDGVAIYAVGSNGSATRFQVLDPKLNPLGGITIKPRVGYPTLNTAPEKLVTISGLQTEFSDGFFAAVDVRSREAPVLRDEI